MTHPDIRQAQTPPSSWYRSESTYHETIERCFPTSWQFVADVAAQHQHTLEPTCILPHSLGEQVLVKRQVTAASSGLQSGTRDLAVFSNVCTHRGTVLMAEPGSPREIRCPYHGRRFSLDGKCIHMPEFADVQGFPALTDNLSPLHTHVLGPLVFAQVTSAEGVPESVFHALHERLDVLGLDRCHLVPEHNRTFELKAHWALYVENYLEGFHVPFVHGGLNAVLDYGAYETHLLPWAVLQVGIAKEGEQCFEELPGRIAALYYWLFPNTMINVYPWGISLNIVEPAGPERTLVHYRVYVMDAAKLGQGAGANLDQVELEDDAIVESVHKGMKSRLYHRGRYSPSKEQGVHHFHRILFGAA
jgi:choline monooxygenase